MEFFESYCKYDDIVLKEFCSCNFRMKIKSRPFIIAYIVLALPTLYFLITENYSMAAFYCFIWLGIIIALLLWISPKRTMNNLKSRLEQSYGGETAELRTIFTDKAMTQHNLLTGDDKEYGYDTIKEIAETDNLFIILLTEGTSCIADKRNFTKGSAEDFAVFITNKMQN